MREHDTPTEVAQELAKYAPRRINTLLDPAVGRGALLAPLIRRLNRNRTEIVCVDSDQAALSELQAQMKLVFWGRPRLINANFLDWSVDQAVSNFDCILMNPPFSGRKNKLTKMLLPVQLRDRIGNERHMPLEAAFVCMAHKLLRDGGRLLAVLPCSVVMAQSLQWLRQFLLDTGALRSVHELPARCFPNVDSRMYLLVFDKARRQRSVKLFNHDLKQPCQLEMPNNRVELLYRLDFGYHDGRRKMDALLRRKELGWCRLGEIATILRGDVVSPIGSLQAIHTCHYKEGFWHQPTGDELPAERDNARNIAEGDILVKRVGRDSYRSFGQHIAVPGLRCSDCVYIVRPLPGVAAEQILFALLILANLYWTKPLLERGTGASYITMDSLSNFWIPTKLFERFPVEFDHFTVILRDRQDKLMMKPLETVSQSLIRHIEYE